MGKFSTKSFTASLHIGVDEAGRGCLAGPVYAGACILIPEKLDRKHSGLIRDSKQMTEPRREEIFEWLLTHHRTGIGIATVLEIERFNILNAALMAMKRAFENLKLSDDELIDCHVFVDGNQQIRGFQYPQTAVVDGDDQVKCISAASILAKVSRDREMRRIHEIYPEYGFHKHKGYGTEAHRNAIEKHGAKDIHRKRFAGVREFISDIEKLALDADKLSADEQSLAARTFS